MKGFALTILVITFSGIQLVHGDPDGRVGQVKDLKENVTVAPPPGVDDNASCTCGHIEDYLKEMKADLLREIQEIIQQTIQKDVESTIKEDKRPVIEDIDATAMPLSKVGRKKKLAAKSCGKIHEVEPSASSRNYWLKGESEVNPGKIYCDFEFEPPLGLDALVFNNSKMEAGWMRLVDFDMRRAHSKCPEGLLQVDSPRKACGNSGGHGCNSLTFTTHGVPYQKVCGMAVGYQHNTPDAFYRYGCPTCENNIDAAYLDGISITYGTPRTHIWSYAAVWTEDHPVHPPRCPCIDDTDLQTPDFVGQDYYCERGSTDELWDGKGCDAVETSCCQHPDLPWFCKELAEPTTEDVEVRLCVDQGTNDENVYVEVMQLYVQ